MKLHVLALSALLLLVPSAPAKAPPDKGNKKADVISSLVRPPSPPDADARGKVRFRSRSKKGLEQDQIDVKVLKVDVSLEHRLFLEDAVDAGTFSDLGALDASDGSLSWSVDTSQGDALPGGATGLGDLSGRRFEVRQGGDVVLEASGPDLAASKKPVNHKDAFSAPDAEADPSGIKAGLRMRGKADKGQHRFVVKVKKAPFADSDIHLWVESDADSGSFLDAGAFDQKGNSSNGRYRRDTHLGAPLPLGVDDLMALGGRRIQVRDDSDVLLELMLPASP
jgi:hypothetical protein